MSKGQQSKVTRPINAVTYNATCKEFPLSSAKCDEIAQIIKLDTAAESLPPVFPYSLQQGAQ